MYNNIINERKQGRQFRCFEAQIQTTAIHVIKEKVNPLARYYNFFRYFVAPVSEAGEEEQRKKKGVSVDFDSSGLVTTRSEIRDFLLPAFRFLSHARLSLSRNLSSFLLAGERKMISPIGREVDRGGTSQRQGQQQQRPRADSSELLHKRVSEHDGRESP